MLVLCDVHRDRLSWNQISEGGDARDASFESLARNYILGMATTRPNGSTPKIMQLCKLLFLLQPTSFLAAFSEK